MADLKVEVVCIDQVEEHPNADRMELAFVGGYQCCVTKGRFAAGDTGIYIPVDSILPEDLEAHIFGKDAKVKLNKHRVRAIKLRGAVAFGLLLHTLDLHNFEAPITIKQLNTVGFDCTKALGITKYQPPVKVPGQMNVGGTANNKKTARHNNPHFHKYTNMNHLKKYWKAFTSGEPVVITEKIHGTNFRAGWVPFKARTFLQKLKSIFGLNPKWEFVYGSHNVQLQNKGGKNAFSDNVYKRIVNEHHLLKIPKGQVWYGEIFGSGIQTGYEYGFKDGKVDVAFFDIMVWDYYLDFEIVVTIIEGFGEQVVPYYRDNYYSDVMLNTLNDPKLVSHIDGITSPVEGFVIRPEHERDFYGGRLILKLLSDEYLLIKDNSDWK
jgi:RNA ligase (TIGR02306 family)